MQLPMTEIVRIRQNEVSVIQSADIVAECLFPDKCCFINIKECAEGKQVIFTFVSGYIFGRAVGILTEI